jgi:hypothetical protein
MFPITVKFTVGTHAELARLTAFLELNTAANQASAPSLVSAEEKAAVLAPVKTAAPGKPKPAATPAATEPTAQASAASQPSSEPVSPTTPTASAQSASVAYPDLQKAVLTLHKADPTAAVPIAKSLGADTFKLLKPEQWAEALRLVNAKIAELQAA